MVVDIVLGSVLWALLLALGVGAVFLSLMFVMAGDSCYSSAGCPNEGLITSGMLVVWFGVAGAGVVALVGTIVSACLRRVFSYWPLIGIVIVIGCTAVGAILAARGGSPH